MIKQKDGFSGERMIVLPQFVIHEMENNPLSAVLHITDIGYYPYAIHHYRERNEPICQYVFIYCTRGEGWYCLDGRTFAVKENQYFILPSGKPHAYGAKEDNPWTIYWIHFKGKLASCFIPYTDSPVDIKPHYNSRINYRINMFEEIFHTLEQGYNMENLLYTCSIFCHYLGTLRYLQQYRNAPDKEEGMLSDGFVSAAVHYMRENLEKKLSLQQLAKHIGYSPSYFSVLFNRHTGYTPLAYFNQLKMQYACRLLDSTDMQVNQLCYKLGIEDPYYFSRLFTKIMGVSPMEYKNKKKS